MRFATTTPLRPLVMAAADTVFVIVPTCGGDYPNRWAGAAEPGWKGSTEIRGAQAGAPGSIAKVPLFPRVFNA